MNPALVKEIAKLPAGERLDLIGAIWDTLDNDDIPLTAEQEAELDRRLATLDEDRTRAVPWETVKAELATRATN